MGSTRRSRTKTVADDSSTSTREGATSKDPERRTQPGSTRHGGPDGDGDGNSYPTSSRSRTRKAQAGVTRNSRRRPAAAVRGSHNQASDDGNRDGNGNSSRPDASEDNTSKDGPHMERPTSSSSSHSPLEPPGRNRSQVLLTVGQLRQSQGLLDFLKKSPNIMRMPNQVHLSSPSYNITLTSPSFVSASDGLVPPTSAVTAASTSSSTKPSKGSKPSPFSRAFQGRHGKAAPQPGVGTRASRHPMRTAQTRQSKMATPAESRDRDADAPGIAVQNGAGKRKVSDTGPGANVLVPPPSTAPAQGLPVSLGAMSWSPGFPYLSPVMYVPTTATTASTSVSSVSTTAPGLPPNGIPVTAVSSASFAAMPPAKMPKMMVPGMQTPLFLMPSPLFPSPHMLMQQQQPASTTASVPVPALTGSVAPNTAPATSHQSTSTTSKTKARGRGRGKGKARGSTLLSEPASKARDKPAKSMATGAPDAATHRATSPLSDAGSSSSSTQIEGTRRRGRRPISQETYLSLAKVNTERLPNETDAEYKKRIRREKNKISAQLCRERKQRQRESLEEKLEQLKSEYLTVREDVLKLERTHCELKATALPHVKAKCAGLALGMDNE